MRMRTLIKFFVAIVLLAGSRNAFAVTVEQGYVCQNAAVPSGWVIVNKTWSKTICGNPATPQGNVWWLERYNNLPVGTPLNMCAFASSTPSGWIPTSLKWNPAICGAQYGEQSGPYNSETVRYALCTNESSTLCYPSLAQFAVISALPTTVPVEYGQGTASAELGWFASQPVCIWVTTAGVGTQLWSCDGNYAVQTWPYVMVGVDQTFIVSPSSTTPSPVLASVLVRGVEGPPPQIYALPSTVTVPSGSSFGSTTISYELLGTGYPSMCIWISNNDGPAQPWACGSGKTFSQVWPYVPKGGKTVLWLNPSSTSPSQVLASVVVIGQ
jgi:hypothetical protein